MESANGGGGLLVADLLRAVEAQDLARVRQLLRAGAAAAGLDASGESALHKAAEDGRTEIFEELLGAAGDPNALDGKGRSVLYRTIINLNEARIKLALAAGADPSATRSDGGKPLWDVFILLIEDQDIMTDEELELLRRLPALLIKAGADPTMWLRLATSQAFDLEAAIKAVPRDKLGAAGEALAEAASEGNVEVLQLLLREGVPPDSLDEDGQSACHMAAAKGQVAALKALLQAGANPALQAQNKSRGTPLHSAASAGQVEAVQCLIAAGADVKRQESSGWQPLHEAADGGHTEVIEELLRAGADPTCTTHNKDTPADLARRKGHGESARVLEQFMSSCVHQAESGMPAGMPAAMPAGVSTYVAPGMPSMRPSMPYAISSMSVHMPPLVKQLYKVPIKPIAGGDTGPHGKDFSKDQVEKPPKEAIFSFISNKSTLSKH